MEHIQKNVCFVDDLSYLQLLDIAKQRLRESWSHSIARTLAERACPSFQERRRFLKGKDNCIKLSRYDDVGHYDLGRMLSLDDFEGRDSILISEAFPSPNFRKTSWLSEVTNRHGRLRLVPDIRKVTLIMTSPAPDYVHLVWHGERHGEVPLQAGDW